MTKAITVMDDVAELLQDIDRDTWTDADLLGWLNDAQRNVVNVRPDSNSATVSFKCATGTRQNLVIGDIRLLRVTRNMGSDGATPGNAINIFERGIKDRFNPQWHSELGQTVVKEYTYDAVARPHVFWVSPPVKVSPPDVYIEIDKAVVPTLLTNKDNDDIELRDTYIPMIHEWMLYKSFARDSEETPNWQRAARHFMNFYAMLGAKLPADIAVDPRLQEHLK